MIAAIVIGITVTGAFGLRWLLINPPATPTRVEGTGSGIGLTFNAPNDEVAATVLLAIAQSKIPDTEFYTIDWMQEKQTPGR